MTETRFILSNLGLQKIKETLKICDIQNSLKKKAEREREKTFRKSDTDRICLLKHSIKIVNRC